MKTLQELEADRVRLSEQYKTGELFARTAHDSIILANQYAEVVDRLVDGLQLIASPALGREAKQYQAKKLLTELGKDNPCKQ